ncbi:hypothetical protein CAEBREN_04375 [Caenorhabditis brenneri]|uniref:Uncharacterized protein n=1 Tax=Caenorhabditis brenneri TaxID=135651 RepID=G0PAI2_CAEBE|nr:hypothetical protein CAEBREN_04375 [Caenorhabditis brenneri]
MLLLDSSVSPPSSPAPTSTSDVPSNRFFQALGKVGPGMVQMSSDDFAEDRNSALLVKAMVVCPKLGSLEKELVEYWSRVFSYLFGFVHNPRRKLTEVFKNGGFRWEFRDKNLLRVEIQLEKSQEELRQLKEETLGQVQAKLDRSKEKITYLKGINADLKKKVAEQILF